MMSHQPADVNGISSSCRNPKLGALSYTRPSADDGSDMTAISSTDNHAPGKHPQQEPGRSKSPGPELG
jgi:hypothetical protein